MHRDDMMRALRRLRDGCDPGSGAPLPSDHLCQRADVVRTLFAAVVALEGADGAPGPAVDAGDPPVAPARPVRPRPPNSGRPWTDADDRRLVEAFDGGAEERELAAEFGRSRTSVRARLIRLGRGALLEDGPAPRYPVAGDLPGDGVGDLGAADASVTRGRTPAPLPT